MKARAALAFALAKYDFRARAWQRWLLLAWRLRRARCELVPCPKCEGQAKRPGECLDCSGTGLMTGTLRAAVLRCDELEHRPTGTAGSLLRRQQRRGEALRGLLRELAWNSGDLDLSEPEQDPNLSTSNPPEATPNRNLTSEPDRKP